ncbi:hypothetical protein ACF090_36385 [Streptomyces sp. NPDC014892]|uniref:hypothetical protein n=1 Tax=Streptomyces sp. NPDC014892 TaxID=3364930 RepID=UPI0036FE9DA2
MGKRGAVVWCGALVVVLGAVGAVWWGWFRAPYALAGSPEVEVTVRAAKSDYPDVARTAEDVDTVVRVYVQRLKAGDVEGLMELAGPAYDGTRGAAYEQVREFGEGARGHVDVTVLEGSVDYFNPVRLTYDRTDQQQELLLVKDDGHWWVALGEGDPAAGKEDG